VLVNALCFAQRYAGLFYFATRKITLRALTNALKGTAVIGIYNNFVEIKLQAD